MEWEPAVSTRDSQGQQVGFMTEIPYPGSENLDMSDFCGQRNSSDISEIRHIREIFYCSVLSGPKFFPDISDYPIYPSSTVVRCGEVQTCLDVRISEFWKRAKPPHESE